LLEATFGPVLRPVVAPDASAPGSPASGGPPGSTVATRLLLEMALFCRELERLLDETALLRPSPAWLRPTYCPDLWAVSLSHLYEADRQNRLWCLDTLVREPLREACDALGRALDEVSPE
jgi:hypothetical protein